MTAPAYAKNELKGKLIDFKTIEVPIDNDDVFMHEYAVELPQLFTMLCCNKDTDLLELSMNLPLLQETSCPVTTRNI